MNTKILFSLLVLPLLGYALSHPRLSKAEETDTRPVQVRNEAIKEANDNLRETRKNTQKSVKKTMEDARMERKASVSATRQTYRSERAKLHGERIEKRFAFYAERLSNIATRLQSRIDKLKAEGKDVQSPQQALDISLVTLEKAINDSKVAVEMFGNISISTWDSQQPEIKAAIVQAGVARTGFTIAQGQMMSVVRQIKENL